MENIKALKRNENQEKFVALRKEWSVFTYERFEVKTDNGGLEATFYFNIDQKHFFVPHIAIPERPFLDWTKIERNALETIVFHIGMIELISYWKTLCPAKVVIKPFALSEPQMRWWKKLYYNGLGEFFYLNGITIGEEEFMQMESDSERGFSPISLPLDEKTLVPIGGGKDSVVTLELLRREMPVTPLIVNPRGATIGCIEDVESDSQAIDPTFFGEGITRTGDHVWQVTWKDGVAMKRDAATLEEIGRVNYQGQGWGMCHFDDRMVMSDGTNQLRVLDPDSFQERSRIDVTKAGAPISQINELDCVPAAESSSGKDEIYANVFTTTSILRIDAATGTVTGVIDASTVPNNAAVDPENVLNGIAHIPGTDRFFITGKRWPDLYEVRFVPAG